MVYAVVWCPDGDQLISAGSDGLIRWWNVASGECMRMQAAHQGTVRRLRISPDGRWLASGGDDGAIWIWNLRSGELVRTLRHDRPYERLDITGIQGLNEAQKATLHLLGAVDTALHSDKKCAPAHFS
jgi:WD40 repeat protein